MKKLGKTAVCMTDFIYRPPYLPNGSTSGFRHSALNPLHRAVNVVSYRLTAMANEMAVKYGAFSLFFLECDLIVRRGYGANTCLTAASSGID